MARYLNISSADGGLIASILACGVVGLFLGVWYHKTSEIAAAYKDYHRAACDYRLSRVAAGRVCAASRRCCHAECTMPLADCRKAMKNHLSRIEILQSIAGNSALSEESDARQRNLYQAYRSEAERWVRQGIHD